jgi:hypothetical protein
VFYMDIAKVDRDVAHVAIVLEVCCKCFRDMLQASIQNVLSVSDVCCNCFISMLHMFQYTYVASVYSKCFICFRCML